MLKCNSISVHSNTPQLATGWPLYRWFWKFFSGFAKSPRAFRSSWILNECNFYFKIVRYYSLSEVCMIKTAPHSTVSPQMWCIKIYTPPDLLERFCKANLSNAKNWACFRRICFRGLIYCDQEPLWLLNVIEDDYQFLSVHMKLSTQCKIWFTLGLFANYFSLKLCSLSLKSHINVL